MATGFNTEMRRQEEWGWLLAIWLFMSGTAAALFLIHRIAALPWGFGLASLVILVVGGGVLLFEQGAPLRAWRALHGIGTSWLSRGVAFVAAFAVSATLSLALEQGSGTARLLGWIAALCAVMVMLYPGLFLAKNRSVPFWRTPLLPALFVASAMAGASALVLVASTRMPQGVEAMRVVCLVAIAASAVLLWLHVVAMRWEGGAARHSVRLLTTGPLGLLFWAGVAAAGAALPMALLFWMPQAVALAGILTLLGCLLLRYCVVSAGVYVPAPALQQGLDFSHLTRTSGELEREYAAALAQRQAARKGADRRDGGSHGSARFIHG